MKLTTITVVGALVLLVGMPIGASTAHAQTPEEQVAEVLEQEEDPNLQELMALRIPRESAGYYADLMGFDDLQREAVDELYRTYVEQYREAALIMRDVAQQRDEMITEAGTDMDKMEEAMGEIMRAGLAFLQRTVDLGEQYVADLGALAMDDQQREAHRRVEHAFDRDLALGFSTMEGGSGGQGAIDLIRLGRRLDPPVLPQPESDSPAQEALYAYEMELAGVCGPHVDTMLENFRAMAKAIGEGEIDERLGETFQEDMVTFFDRVNVANERYVRRVGDALPEERREEWSLAYKRARWPEVYAPTNVHRTRDAALGLDDLSDDQHGAIDAAFQQYARECEASNKRWIDAMRELEETRRSIGGDWNQELFEQFQARQQAINEARESRYALDQRFADRIRSALTPEQLERMPEAASDGVDADEVIRRMGGG